MMQDNPDVKRKITSHYKKRKLLYNIFNEPNPTNILASQIQQYTKNVLH